MTNLFYFQNKYTIKSAQMTSYEGIILDFNHKIQ